MKIQDAHISFDLEKQTLIIAELSGNHNHDLNFVMKSIKAAKEAGADAVKSQTYTPDTITLNVKNKFFTIKQDSIWDDRTFYDLYQEAYTPWEWQPKMQKYCHELGMIFFSSAFDRSAVDFLEKMHVPAHKIASPEITDIPLIKYAASKKKPMFFSTGIAELKDIKLALETSTKEGNRNIAFLKCTTAYPTPLEEVNLRTIPKMKALFHTVVGLSDHTIGFSVATASIPLGAQIIEKHFILDKKIGGPDASFSMEPKNFFQMTKAVREIEKALGKVSFSLTEHQKKSRQGARSLFVAVDMDKGEIFTEKSLRSVRPNYGLHPKYFRNILGKKASRKIRAGTPLSWELVQK